MRRSLLAAAVVFALPVAAFAQDASVLNGKDDIAFARALVAHGYPDLAERLLGVVEKSSKRSEQVTAPIAAAKLDLAQGAAMEIGDLQKRGDALLKVLAEKEKFIDDFKGTDAAADARNALPDLWELIGQTIVAEVEKQKDPAVLGTRRDIGDAFFGRVEKVMKDRIAELYAIADRTPGEDDRLLAALYSYPRTLYVHALLFPKGSARRVELCTAALREFDEYDFDRTGNDPWTLSFYAYVDSGLCLGEIGKPDEAIKSIDRTIGLRESWGPADEKTGVWPIPAEAGDVADLVCYATLQKMIVLSEQKRFGEVVKVGRDWFASMRNPHGPPSSKAVADELAKAQSAGGAAK